MDKPDWGFRTVLLRDSDGNLLQLESELRKDKWTERLRKEAQIYRGEG